jgi:hypothetical protein
MGVPVNGCCPFLCPFRSSVSTFRCKCHPLPFAFRKLAPGRNGWGEGWHDPRTRPRLPNGRRLLRAKSRITTRLRFLPPGSNGRRMFLCVLAPRPADKSASDSSCTRWFRNRAEHLKASGPAEASPVFQLLNIERLTPYGSVQLTLLFTERVRVAVASIAAVAHGPPFELASRSKLTPVVVTCLYFC